jgi:hypothetical protein
MNFKTLLKVKISFCTTCKGRLFQLERTLPENLLRTAGFDDVEFVILNYNSPDNLHLWIQAHMIKHIRSGRIRYALNPEPAQFHSSKAKNQAHRIATGDILVNLDSDNFIGESYKLIKETFVKSKEICLQMYGGRCRDGTFGRIAMHKDYFYALGGYDESFLPMGGQDVDLIHRAKAFGLSHVLVKDNRIGSAIRNSLDLNMQYTGFSGKDYSHHNNVNLTKMRQNLAAKIIVANQGKRWGEISRLVIAQENDVDSSNTMDSAI